MDGRNITSILLLVVGGLWLCLTGACSVASFAGMPASDGLPLTLLGTFPGCVLVLAGLALRLPRSTVGPLVLAYAAVLSFVGTNFMVTDPGAPHDKLMPIIVINIPSFVLGIWGLALVHKRRNDPAP